MSVTACSSEQSSSAVMIFVDCRPILLDDLSMTENQFRDIFVNQTRHHPFRTFLVECDYDCCVWYYDVEGKTFFPIDEGDKVFIHPENEEDEEFVTVPGLTEWRKEFGPELDKTVTGEVSYFDWDSWNARGKALAEKLSSLLPEGYYVYYTPPYEDTAALETPPELV